MARVQQDRVTVNLATEDESLSSDELDRLVEKSDCSNRSEYIRKLLLDEKDSS